MSTMSTMSVDVATVGSATSVAGARDSARAFLGGLDRPIAAEAADTVVWSSRNSSPTPCVTAAVPAP